MNIYAILKDDDIKRISLSQELQTRLHEYINASINNFENAEKKPFSGEYKPEENEILLIEEFNNPYENFDSLSSEILLENEIENIKTIVFANSEKIAYQCFDNRKIIRPEKWYLIYSKNTYTKMDNKGLIIEQKIDALYLIEQKELLFFSYHNASKIFDLSEYYKEATDEEVKKFYENKLFKNENNIKIESFNKKLRKKIYLIHKNNVLEKVKEKFDAVSSFAQDFGLNDLFDHANKRIKFPNEKKMIEKLVNFLNDDLFKSPITEYLYETNSKRKLPK